ncbi:MAG: hypothetical protein AAB401_17750, partial [Acidobacteriota bacterium]
MNKKIVAPVSVKFVRAIRNFLLLVVLLSLVCSSTLAAQPGSDWKKVKKKSGSLAVVITKSGQQFDGSLVEVSDEALKINAQGRTEEVKKADVAEVRVKKKGGGNKLAWIGGSAAAGFGIGAAIGKVTNTDDESGLGSFGPIIGGAIG